MRRILFLSAAKNHHLILENKSRVEVNRMSIIDRLLGKQKATTEEKYYVHGSGLVRIPNGRVHEIPKVIQEFHEREAARARLMATARR